MKGNNSTIRSYIAQAASRGATEKELAVLCDACLLEQKYGLGVEQVLSPCAIMIDVPTFDTKEDAEKIYGQMLEIATVYGDISVNDYYTLCGLKDKAGPIYNRYGWRKSAVQELKIEPCAYGYIIDVTCADRLC